jgi:imidazolonepropionase-like amidohydrolase
MEMRALLDAGLTPMEVIEAGTRLAACVCGQENELGTLEPGKLADIIIIDGDPLTDIEAFNRISYVIIDGKMAVSSHR